MITAGVIEELVSARSFANSNHCVTGRETMHCKTMLESVLLTVCLSLLWGTMGVAQTIDVEYAKGKQYVTEGADIRKDRAVYPAADLVAMMPEDLDDGDFIGKYVLKRNMKPLKRGVYYVWVAKEGDKWKSRLKNSLGEGVSEGTVRIERMSSSTKSLTEPRAQIVRRQTATAVTVPDDCSFCMEHWCLHIAWPF